MGAHKKPFYRIVVADSRSPRDGRFIEEIGYYNPLTDPSDIKIHVEKAKKWISTGAKPTDTVRGLLKKAGVFEVVKAAAEEQDAAREAGSAAEAPADTATDAARDVSKVAEAPDASRDAAPVAEAPAETPADADGQTDTAADAG
jgi:small subunit ribosomal protein S16